MRESFQITILAVLLTAVLSVGAYAGIKAVDNSSKIATVEEAIKSIGRIEKKLDELHTLLLTKSIS